MQKLAFVRRRRHGVSRNDENGQTMIFVVVGLAVVLLAIVGFAVDYGNIWFRRQHAQNAADSVCIAAVMDMLNNVSAGGPTGGVTTGTNFDCTSGGSPTSAPCQYAVLNGYSGAGLTAGTESNTVEVSFPTSLTGNPVPVCPSPIPVGMKVCVPPSAMTSNPFVQVKITSRLKATFFGLLSANNTVDVPAQASCGVVLASAPIPLLVLDPDRANALQGVGTSGIAIYGGPQRSIQVNSTNASAIGSNGNVQIDLTQGGPNVPPTGSDLGTSSHQSLANQVSNATPIGSCSKFLCVGTTGQYSPGVRPILDPFASITAPSKLLMANGTVTTVTSPNDGCPALPAGSNCDEYSPGYYPSGISVVNKYAIFQPGIYYVEGGILFGSNSCIRPSTAAGDGSGGTFFYLADNTGILVKSNSGCNTSAQTNATNFSTTTGGPAGFAFGAACDTLSSTNAPGNLPAVITGSVLLAPCLQPVSNCAPNCSINGGRGYGDPLGSADPAGISRGLLFMQNRNQTTPMTATFSGGGAFLLSGSMYFHQCHATGTVDTGGTSCASTPSAYNDVLTLGGNSAGNSYVLGDIVVDRLSMNGTPNIYMDLSPNSLYFIYKATLMQ